MEFLLGTKSSCFTGWFGFGSALENFALESVERNRSLLLEMAREWQFFQALISNIDMVMAKADIGIARRYARLCPTLKFLAKCLLKSKRSGSKQRELWSLLLGLGNTCYQP